MLLGVLPVWLIWMEEGVKANETMEDAGELLLHSQVMNPAVPWLHVHVMKEIVVKHHTQSSHMTA